MNGQAEHVVMLSSNRLAGPWPIAYAPTPEAAEDMALKYLDAGGQGIVWVQGAAA